MLDEDLSRLAGEVYAFLGLHIQPLQDPRKWLPILALAHTVEEWMHQIASWQRDKYRHKKERLHPELASQVIFANRRRLISIALIGLISGALIISFSSRS
jgi:hypothetical protein